MTPEDVIEVIKTSGLAGRGGAGSVSYTHLDVYKRQVFKFFVSLKDGIF